MFSLYCDKCGLINPCLVRLGFCSTYIWPWLRKHECCHSEDIFVTGTGFCYQGNCHCGLYFIVICLTGPMIHWSNDQLVRWSIILTAHWSYVSLVQRPIGTMFPCSYYLKILSHPIGLTIHWSHNSLVLRLIGPTSHWSYTLEPRGCTAHWSHDPLSPTTQ